MVVFFDIDGTLVDDRTQVLPESAVRAVAQLRANGHVPVINTGRPYTHIDPRVRAMAFSGFVCGCGMEVMLNDRWLQRKHPDDGVCELTRDAVRECRMQVLYETQDGAILTDGELSTHPIEVQETERMRKKGFAVREIDSLPKPWFMKFVTFDGPDSRREEFISQMKPYFTCIDRGNTMLEMVLQGCTKADGMALLLDALGASREDTLAIGDSTNDLPMFQMAGHTACMGGGMEQLKERAEFITDTVLNDGIEKALQHYGLI